MPLYALKCLCCSHKWDEFAAMKDRDGIKCPECKKQFVASDFERVTIRTLNRVFGGSDEESRIHFCHPDDASKWNQMLGVNNYQSDGSVKFADRKDEQKFRRAMENWKKSGLDQQLEQKAMVAEKIKRGKLPQISTDSTLALREREDTAERRKRVDNLRKHAEYGPVK